MVLDAGRHSSLESLSSIARRYGASTGLTDVLIYLADLQEKVFRLLGDGDDTGDAPAAEVQIDGSLAGRAFQNLRPEHDLQPVGGSWWLPLLNGSERLGVLHARTERDDEDASQSLQLLAALVALLLISNRPCSDTFARLVRTRTMSVVSEMQWQLMPPRTFSEDHISISAMLEPAYETSGDAFDYAMAGRTLHFAIFDAMGHDTTAGLAVNLALAAYRRHRRNLEDLVAIGEAIERTLIAEFGDERFVTAIMAKLDTRTGMMNWVSHGHPNPVIIRGGRWGTPLDCQPGHPLGSELGLAATSCQTQLEPEDRVVCYTDGIIEAVDADGREFGLDHFLDFIVRHHADGLPVPETLRRLIHALLRRNDLLDDATVLITEWLGP